MTEINFKPSLKQWEALEILKDSETTELGYGGAAGGGKSYLGCYWLFESCITYDDTAWLMGRKELTNLKKTTLVSFYKLCKELGVKTDDYFILDHQSNILNFRNGSRIFLMDLSYMPSDPLYNRLGSLELTGAFVDESPEIMASCINILKTRLGRCNNEKYNLTPKLLETFNPNKNHVYYRYYKPFIDGKLPKHRKFIRALVTDNPYIDKNYVDQLKNADEITRQRLLYGNFEYDDDPSSLIEFKAITKIFTKEYTKSHKKYISVDVARLGKDLMTVFVWDGLYITKEFHYPKTKINEAIKIVDDLAVIENVPRERIVIDEDGVGGGVVDGINGVVGFINNSRAFNEKGVKTNYKNLKAQCSYKLAEYINSGKIGMKCNDDSVKERLIQELEQIKRKEPDKDGPLQLIGKEIVKEEIGRSPDFSDCMMMRMYFEVIDTSFVSLDPGGMF